MGVIKAIAKFIEQFCSGSEPLLLGLSGGPDSLALYYGLLSCQRKYNISFHIAHIDHGWRLESAQEAEQMRRLAERAEIPFHLRKLKPAELKGNLEMAFRIERYRFFAELCQTCSFQGVLVGHQRDDQSETILKKLLEGAHWSCLAGLKPESWVNGVRVLRPLLNLSKNEIYAFLKEIDVRPFEDASNQDERFMRARMRQTIIPWLNRTFGKNVQPSLVNLSQEMMEVKEFFDQRSKALLSQSVEGPFGVFLDLKNLLPSTLLEIKYLLKSFCELHEISLSRVQYQLGAESLQKNAANQCYTSHSKKKLYIDRQRLFIISVSKLNSWCMECKDQIAGANFSCSPFIELWQGTCRAWLPEGTYKLGSWQEDFSNKKKIDKWWTNHGVPAFLRSFFPVICQGSVIVHEFLSGRCLSPLLSKKKSIEITMRYVCVDVECFPVLELTK